MRLHLSALGLALDVSFGVAEVEAEDEDYGSALNGGTLASQPVGFYAAHEIPEEVAAPQHCPSWDEPD